MPPINDDNTPDDETNDEDAEFRAALMLKLGEAVVEPEDDDDGGFGAQPIKKVVGGETVSADEGFDLVDKAKFARLDKEKAAETTFDKMVEAGADKPAIPADAAKPADDAAKPADVAAAIADLSASPLDDLLAGIDDTKRGEIAKRLSAGDALTGLFKGREEEMKLHGVNPAQAMARMLQLNQFAQEKPNEYLAWVATEMNRDAPHTVLESAAKLLGFKLVPEAGDGDEFEDPAIKALREENAALKRAQPGSFGPDAPQNTARMTVQQTLHAFENAVDATGQPKHPHLDMFRGQVAAKAKAHREGTGQIPTADDLSRFYGEVESVARAAFAPAQAQAPAPAPVTSAAQVTPAVATTAQTQAAADIEKSKAASKMLDGSGQGADRRPALPADTSLRDVIAHAIKVNS